MMNTYSDIALDVVKSMNSKILNSSFKKLVDNDSSIVPIQNYIPNIWENRWFNDEVIPGYDKGYCVWRNTYTDITSFLNDYGDQVYAYAQNNARLKSYIVSSWIDISCNSDLTDYDRQQYVNKFYNVISGYSETQTSVYWDPIDDEEKKVVLTKKFFDPLYDYGPMSCTTSPVVEVYVSTVDNNKDLLSSDTWKSVVLSSQRMYDEYIETEVSILMDKHLHDYHLNGLMSPTDVNEILLTRSLSNFSLDLVQSKVKLRSHEQYANFDGFDYVVDFKKDEVTSEVDGHAYKHYRWYRLWSSGYLEHAGVVYCPKSVYPSGTADSYEMKVDLSWDGQAPIYDYPEISSTPYGLAYNNLYYAEGAVREIVEGDNWLSPTSRYTIQITPIKSDPNNDISVLSHTYKDFAQLSDFIYPDVPMSSNKNHPFLDVEVHQVKNESFCFTKLNLDDLTDNSYAQFYSYYTTGFRVGLSAT